MATAKKSLRDILESSFARGDDLLTSYAAFLTSAQHLERGLALPKPRVITIDPIAGCNLKCEWCNASSVLEREAAMLSKATLFALVDFLREWDEGIEAVAFSGGGEPLMHPDLAEVIERCAHSDRLIALSTNGVRVDEFIEPLSWCHWIGASIDVGSGALMKDLKSFDFFERLTCGIRSLVNYSKKRNAPLTRKPYGLGVTYRYLVHPGNVHEIHKAAQIAKEIGCANFYFRPASIPWNQIEEGKKAHGELRQELASALREEVGKSKALEDRDFRVLGFTDNCSREGSPCGELLSTAICMPAGSGNSDEFDLGLCYDRRGDDSVLLGRSLKDPHEICGLWNSETHWRLFEQLDTSGCPYCSS